MCRCINCGKPCDCGEEYCEQHLIDESDAEKNLYVGGRFYGGKLLPGDTVEAKEDKMPGGRH